MPLAFHTARYGHLGPDALDISRKGADPFGVTWAPSWGLLKPYLDKRKAGGLTDEDWQAYRRAFLEEMRASYTQRRGAWDALLSRNHATLLCWCLDPGRCHRTLVAWILLQLGAQYLGELNRNGTKSEHVAVVGSRPPKPDAPAADHAEWERIVSAVWGAVRALPPGAVMVSGAAPGVDSLAEHATGAGVDGGAERRRIILPAPWDKLGIKAGPVRNSWVSRVADRAVAIPSSWSVGTRHLIDLMERAGKPVEVLKP